MTAIAIGPGNRAASLQVDASGNLKVTSAGGGGGGDATAANQTAQTTELQAIKGYVDGIETLLTATNGYVDGLETLIGSTNTKLDTLHTDVDGLETAVAATNTKLDSLISANGRSGGREYETVAASQTDQAMGATGATGDYIEGLICVVSTAATSQVQIKDGAGSAITVLPNNVGAGIGTYYVPLGLTSLAGAWKVTTAAGVSVIACGDFT